MIGLITPQDFEVRSLVILSVKHFLEIPEQKFWEMMEIRCHQDLEFPRAFFKRLTAFYITTAARYVYRFAVYHEPSE